MTRPDQPDAARDLASLIAKLEAASEGSSELDWEIYLHATDRGKSDFAKHKEQLILPWPQWIEYHPIELRLPHAYDCGKRPYTRSIDAALTLVPEGVWWSLFRSGYPTSNGPDRGLFDARITSGQGKDDPKLGDQIGWGFSPSPALAICIAALRARQGETP